MQNKKLHIILTLVVVFLIPILYQPLHIIEHQTTTSFEVKCELAHAHSNTKSDSELQKKQDKCLVCSYELTVQKVTKLTQYTPPSTALIALITANQCSSASVSVALKHITRPPPTA